MKKVLCVSLIAAAFFANLAEGAAIPKFEATEAKTPTVVSMDGHRVLGLDNESSKIGEGTCWFNATMQFLRGIPEFRSLLSDINL